MRVSHETIYKSLFIPARGVLKKELMEHLRSRRIMRRAKTATTAGQPRGRIIDAISIRERGAEIEDWARARSLVRPLLAVTTGFAASQPPQVEAVG